LKLTARPAQIEFYESFSDLIFGTLVLFIVLVLALTLKLNEAIEELEVAATDIVSKAHFTGGANETQAIVCAVPKGDSLEMIWIPTEIDAGWDKRGPDGTVSNAPFVALCELALRPGGFTRFSAENLPKLAKAFSKPCASGFAFAYSYGEAIYLIERRLALGGPELENVTSESLAATVGRLEVSPNDINGNVLAVSDPRLNAARSEYVDWATNRGTQDRIWRYDFTAGVVWQNSTPGEEVRMRIQVTEKEGPIHVGELKLSPHQVGDILAAIKPGVGYYLEVTNELGEDSEPPTWVFEKLLVPSGYIERVLREGEG
jgi:hypothetical protein